MILTQHSCHSFLRGPFPPRRLCDSNPAKKPKKNGDISFDCASGQALLCPSPLLAPSASADADSRKEGRKRTREKKPSEAAWRLFQINMEERRGKSPVTACPSGSALQAGRQVSVTGRGACFSTDTAPAITLLALLQGCQLYKDWCRKWEAEISCTTVHTPL